jgi:hypothetical protein
MFAYISIVITYVITIAECRVGRVQSVGESGCHNPVYNHSQLLQQLLQQFDTPLTIVTTIDTGRINRSDQ